MRAVVQRVSSAKVDVDGRTVRRIDKKGLLVYLSVGKGDTAEDAKFIAEKIVNLRIFEDDSGRMNRSIINRGGIVLLVSNFTLHGDCRKGRRPGFDAAAEPKLAEMLYEKVIDFILEKGVKVANGAFGEHMHVESVNEGPVTLLLDSQRL